MYYTIINQGGTDLPKTKTAPRGRGETKMKYFKNIETTEVLKQYKDLVKKYHPDCGGDHETMAAINAEYQSIIEGGIDGQTIDIDAENDLKAAIMAAVKIDGNIVVEVCGRWIWVSGDTKPVKDDLKAAGYKWARRKKMWYYRPVDDKARRTKSMDMDYIRETYGSKTVKRGRPALAAG